MSDMFRVFKRSEQEGTGPPILNWLPSSVRFWRKFGLGGLGWAEPREKAGVIAVGWVSGR